ncbi:MAG: hypothetical protein H2184_00515 [Candidatus Galacturonibacter soehngenii]|nr:hypothetical protein [Candidatus Galacturonibacter soehngenii]
MKKTIIKAIILAVVFIIGIYFLTIFRGRGEVDQITNMSAPTLPTLYLNSFSEDMNELHGYTTEMEANYMRDTITPLSSDLTLPVTIKTYGEQIKKISYEVRSLDTTRLVEQTDVTDFKEETDTVTTTFDIKNLLEEGKEYILKINISTKTAENINYYTRIIKNENLKVKEKLNFIKEFNQKTFDKEAAKDLVIYLESNAYGDNSNFHRVNINSKFEQVTWGSLNIKQETFPIPEIKEIDKQTASVTLNYMVSVQNEDSDLEYCNVTEYYRVRYTQDRNYLLDFERTMSQMFDEENLVCKENRLTLGIRDQNIEFKESNNGTIVSFVQEGELYWINLKENKVAKIFSFKNNISDARENYNQYDIKVLSVDDEGNVDFIVYGYMNRGNYEGQVGIDALTYNGSTNTLEENVFIPSTRPYQILKESVNRFVYQNGQRKLFVDMDNTIYSIDLIERTYDEVVSNINPDSYVISKDNKMIAWQNGEDTMSATKITIINLSSGQRNMVSVEEDERVLPIGFMDDDFIYGVAKTEDIFSDITGTTLFPMYCIRIQNNIGEIIDEYKPDGIYIVDAQIQNNVIKLTRATLEEAGYSYVSDDSIMNSLESEEGKTKTNSIVSETKQQQQQLIFATNFSSNEPTLIHPKQILVKEDIVLKMKATKNQQDKYYVYGKGQLQGIYRNISEAVTKADQLYGVVVDDKQEYIWERGNRLIRTMISQITANQDTTGNSLATCLDAMLELEGTNVDSAALMERGENAVSILEQHIEGKIIELSNASLSAALYYVSKGAPVIAKLSSGTRVLIVGYDELNISVMNPETGKIYKMGMNDSTNEFAVTGGVFITYIKSQK